MKNDLFVEVGHFLRQKAGNEVCGDVFLSQKINAEKRTIIILSDGLGSGIKANILATMTASMALNFIKSNSPIEHTARIIMNTLPIDSFRKASFSSFTIIDIQEGHKVKLMEYGNPGAIIWRNGSCFEPDKTEVKIRNNKVKQRLYTSEFNMDMNDRIIVFSDGISQAGMGRPDTPFGWGSDNLRTHLESVINDNRFISAGDLAKNIVNRAMNRDSFLARDDMSAGSVYFREPRKMLLCTGPPYKPENDRYLADSVNIFNGCKIICGGTTAQIVSRILDREVTLNMADATEGLPPDASMDGVDLVTEGILTIGRVSEFLERYDQLADDIKGPAGKIIKFFHRNDEIHFLVGTRVNEAHQDPNLPVELEIRRNVVKKIAQLLEKKFLKGTEIEYI